jgi:hypothetical protein
MKIVLFTIPGSPPIIGNVTDDTTEHEYMKVEYPVVFLKEEDKVYTIPYMPLAKFGIVLFNRSNIVSVSAVDEEIKNEYEEVVKALKLQKHIFKKPDEEKLKKIIDKKVLH